MMLSASGGIFMAKANDLIVVFLGLEILSIALYVLAGYHRRRSQSQEAAIKYFVLGVVLLRLLPVRDRPHLRGHRVHQHHRDRRASSRGRR